MERSSSSSSGTENENVATRKPPVWALNYSSGIALVALALLIALALYAVNAHREHVKRLERTHEMAAQVTAQVEATFSGVDRLSAAETSALRTYRNKDHLAAAERLGITGIASVQEAAALGRRDDLVRISDGATYAIQELDYSVPYLVPSGAALLERIGDRFQRRLTEQGLPAYQFVVTSVTRTREHQQALRRVNINAATESSHEYGTTFDVHYGKFRYAARPVLPGSADIYEELLSDRLTEAFAGFAQEYDAALKALLGRTLIQLQDEGTAMTIHERRQPVFHITVARELS